MLIGVFGRAVLRRVGQLHLLQIEDRHARLNRHREHIDSLVHASPAHGLGTEDFAGLRIEQSLRVIASAPG